MAEELNIPEAATKKELYTSLLPQLKALVTGEPDLIANMANIAAAIYTATQYLWVGFYIVKDNELVLGPFQGPIACTRIKKGSGVCGSAWATGQTQIVPNVDEFPGHIACSSASKSEIVVPALTNGLVLFVFDVDSTQINGLDAEDARFFEQVVALLLK